MSQGSQDIFPMPHATRFSTMTRLGSSHSGPPPPPFLHVVILPSNSNCTYTYCGARMWGRFGRSIVCRFVPVSVCAYYTPPCPRQPSVVLAVDLLPLRGRVCYRETASAHTHFDGEYVEARESNTAKTRVLHRCGPVSAFLL